MSWLRRKPRPQPAPRFDFAAMKMEESMQNLVRAEFAPKEHPRDLDEGRIPQTPDLFADGLEIAQAVLDWEERAGQPITALIEHIKAAQELRKSVTTKANEGAVKIDRET